MSRYALQGRYYPSSPDPVFSRRYAVSPGRADELRAEWLATWNRWSDAATIDQLDGWAETFAPDHPEWFEDSATSPPKGVVESPAPSEAVPTGEL